MYFYIIMKENIINDMNWNVYLFIIFLLIDFKLDRNLKCIFNIFWIRRLKIFFVWYSKMII